MPVNELSSTIDLPFTLVRAEQLFKRFQRTVEAIDRRDHFPIPSNAHRRKLGGQPQDSGGASTSSARDTSSASHGIEASKPESAQQFNKKDSTHEFFNAEKVISVELRNMLRKDMFYALNTTEVKEHGGGVGS
jgi:hypothetical protein